ncbi:MAG: divalent-cation tolerance protein CutA [Gammaproteobacteria bacterium]|nr:divalent-cation tolerance protein CutA [Gammaproteobacteria bacterium]
MEHLILFCTCPDANSAERIAEALVDRRFAACVNIVPGIKSVYRWQGQRESAQEVLLLIKSSDELYPLLEQMIRDIHPYELPEIIAVPVKRGLAPYLAWIGTSLMVNERNGKS